MSSAQNCMNCMHSCFWSVGWLSVAYFAISDVSAACTNVRQILRLYIFSVALRPCAGHGLLTLEVSGLHTTTHHDSSWRVISSSQRPLPDNTQQTNNHAPLGFEPTISAGERPQTYAVDRAAIGTGIYIYIQICRLFFRSLFSSNTHCKQYNGLFMWY